MPQDIWHTPGAAAAHSATERAAEQHLHEAAAVADDARGKVEVRAQQLVALYGKTQAALRKVDALEVRACSLNLLSKRVCVHVGGQVGGCVSSHY